MYLMSEPLGSVSCVVFLRGNEYHLLVQGRTAVAQWLRCSATNRKVSGSIPAGVSGFFHPTDRTMALGSTHPLT